MIKTANLAVALLASALLLGCESSGIDIEPNKNVRENSKGESLSPLDKEQTYLGGGDLLSFATGGGDEPAGAQLPVNKHLWRGTLDTLAFLPLSSTDPYGGVIVTDWGASPDAPDERFKVTAYITSAELKPQSLKVVVNRQTKGKNGEWIAAGVSEDTGRKLEDAILTRARQLRIAENGEES